MMRVICYNRPVERASSNDYKTRVRPELRELLAAVEVVSCIRITSEQFKSIRLILFQKRGCFAVKNCNKPNPQNEHEVEQ